MQCIKGDSNVEEENSEVIFFVSGILMSVENRHLLNVFRE